MRGFRMSTQDPGKLGRLLAALTRRPVGGSGRWIARQTHGASAGNGKVAPMARQHTRRARVGLVGLLAGLIALAAAGVALASFSQQAPPAPFVVNSNVDRADSFPGDGICSARV